MNKNENSLYENQCKTCVTISRCLVGDGINDALSLVAADVGISIGQGKADLAVRSSDVIVLRNNPTSLLDVIKMGKKLIGVIKQNYALLTDLKIKLREAS